MADAFLKLPAEDRCDALEMAADATGRPIHLLEKDVWVVWALETLFGSALRAGRVVGGPPGPVTQPAGGFERMR